MSEGRMLESEGRQLCHEQNTSLMFLRVERETTSMALRQDEQEEQLKWARHRQDAVEHQLKGQQNFESSQCNPEHHRLSGKPQVRLTKSRCRELHLVTPGVSGGDGFHPRQSQVFALFSLQGIVSDNAPLSTARYTPYGHDCLLDALNETDTQDARIEGHVLTAQKAWIRSPQLDALLREEAGLRGPDQDECKQLLPMLKPTPAEPALLSPAVFSRPCT